MIIINKEEKKAITIIVSFVIGFILVLIIGWIYLIKPIQTVDAHGDKDVCYGDCPTFNFHAEREVCPVGYEKNQHKWEEKDCRKWSVWHYVYADYVTESFDLTDVQRIKSEEIKCHKPTPESLEIPEWAISEYEKIDEWVLPEVVDCPPVCEWVQESKCTAECGGGTADWYHRGEGCDNAYEQRPCNEQACDITPTPEPTVTPVPEKGLSEAGAPQCEDHTPLVLPSNVHVIRNGPDATVNFFSSSSNANIYYKNVNSPDWQYSARDIPVTEGYVSYTIHDLDPLTGYTFAVQSANSCAGGETVLAVVEDDWQPMTFNLSYWTWL